MSCLEGRDGGARPGSTQGELTQRSPWHLKASHLLLGTKILVNGSVKNRVHPCKLEAVSWGIQ